MKDEKTIPAHWVVYGLLAVTVAILLVIKLTRLV